MGANTSSQVNDSSEFLEIISEAVVKNISRCQAGLSNQQIIHSNCRPSERIVELYVNSYGCRDCLRRVSDNNVRQCREFCVPCVTTGVTQNIDFNLSSNCEVTSQMTQQMTSEIMAKFDQRAKKDTDAISEALSKMGFGNQENTSNRLRVENRLRQALAVEVVQEMIMNLSNLQKVEISGLGVNEGLHQSIVATVVQNGFMKTEAGQDLVSKLQLEAKQAAERKAQLLNFMTGVVLIVGFGVAGYVLLKRRTPLPI